MPSDGLPKAITSDVVDLLASLHLPIPVSVDPLDSSSGAFHSIYIITFDATSAIQASVHDGFKRLVLRISAGELPGIKTMNEVAMIKWVRENTGIPAPAIIAFDHTRNNALKNEYTITEYVIGKPLSEAHEQIRDCNHLVNQIIDYLVELYRNPFDHVGGLQIDNGTFSPGPMTEWHFWTTKDTQYWDDPLSMNAVGPFGNYAEYCIDTMRMFKKAIDHHPLLEFLRSLPLNQLIDTFDQEEENIASSRYVLAHRDFHFGNIMFDIDRQEITAIIDWELAAILPYQLWNPGNFLWTGGNTTKAEEDKAGFIALFENLCRKRQVDYLLDTSFISQDQALMQEVTHLLRKLVNAYLRGWQRSHINQFRQHLEEIIDTRLIASKIAKNFSQT